MARRGLLFLFAVACVACSSKEHPPVASETPPSGDGAVNMLIALGGGSAIAAARGHAKSLRQLQKLALQLTYRLKGLGELGQL